VKDSMPAEAFQKGDTVQAVAWGPTGTVIDADRYGWTLVQYPRQQGTVVGGLMNYKHGVDRLRLVERAS
jgi:hypothetical protein